MAETGELLELCHRVARLRLPRWNELPDLELYMDQVLSLIERYLDGYPGRKGLTAAMVNNYVKLGVMPPPVKKRYTRLHLAYLIVICVLKASLPIDSIKRMAAEATSPGEESRFYDGFCDAVEQSVREAAEAAIEQLRAGGPESALYRTALRAQAEQALALELYETSFERTEN